MVTTDRQPPRRRRPAEIRALILSSAAREFTDNGYAATTTTGIAARAEVSPSVLYRHFASKAELFSQVTMVPLVEFLEKIQIDFARYTKDQLDSEQLMQTFLSDLFTSLEEHRDALAGLAGAWNELNDETTDALRRALDDMFSRLSLFAELESSRQGWYPREGMELVTRLLVCMVFGMSTYDKLLMPVPRGVPDDSEILHTAAKLVTWGLIREDWRKRSGCSGHDGADVVIG